MPPRLEHARISTGVKSPQSPKDCASPKIARKFGTFALIEILPLEIVTVILEIFLREDEPVYPDALFSKQHAETTSTKVAVFYPSSGDTLILIASAFFRVNTIRVCPWSGRGSSEARFRQFRDFILKRPEVAPSIRSLSFGDTHAFHRAAGRWRCLTALMPKFTGLTHIRINRMEGLYRGTWTGTWTIPTAKLLMKHFNARYLLGASSLKHVELVRNNDSNLEKGKLKILDEFGDMIVDLFGEQGRVLVVENKYDFWVR